VYSSLQITNSSTESHSSLHIANCTWSPIFNTYRYYKYTKN